MSLSRTHSARRYRNTTWAGAVAIRGTRASPSGTGSAHGVTAWDGAADSSEPDPARAATTPSTGHHHAHRDTASSSSRGALSLTLGLTAIFFVDEILGAWVSGSLALLVDAGHLLTAAGGFTLALFATWITSRPPCLVFRPPGSFLKRMTTRARTQLGWRPRHDFQSAILHLRAGEDSRSPLARAVGSNLPRDVLWHAVRDQSSETRSARHA